MTSGISAQRGTSEGGDAPFVSIVVPTCNRVGPLGDCLRSLRTQDYPAERFEIVVVVNGSAGLALPRPRALSREGDSAEVRVLALRRRDANTARNAGALAARGDPICFVDDDVVAPPGWLAALAAGAERHPEAGCFGGAIRPCSEAPALRTCAAHSLGGTTLDKGRHDVEVRAVWGPNMAIPRRSFERVGLFREGPSRETAGCACGSIAPACTSDTYSGTRSTRWEG
jgi:GT2 family glycosyltransferase